MVKLTIKQEKFIQGLLKGLSQREAFKQSYNTSKMKATSIDVNACKLLKTAKVAQRYEELREKITAKAEKTTIATAIEIMEYYTRVMRDEEKEPCIVQEQVPVIGDDGKKKGYRIMNKIMMMPVNIRDRTKVAELLGKRFGLDKIVGDLENTDIKIDIIGNDEDGD